MSTTDIRHEPHEPATPVEVPPSSARRRRPRVTAPVLAAVVALVAAGVSVAAWLAGFGADDGPPPTDASTPEEIVAQDFLSAFTTLDAARVARYLAEDARMPDEWWRDLKRYDAWGAVFLVQPCETLSTSVAGTNISCAFDLHAFGTDELGRPPFGRNVFTLRVDDGKVESFQATYGAASNGFMEQLDAIGSWVRANHPGDWAFMNPDADVSDADFPRWLQLWKERLAGYGDRFEAYVEATTGG